MKSVRSIMCVGTTLFLALFALMLCSCLSSPEAKSAKFMASGKKLLQKNDAARAILQFESAAKATPRNPEIYYQLGIAYLAAGDLRNGVACLRKALELNPKHAAAQLRLAQLMASTSEPDVLTDAQHRLQALLQDTPDNPDALHALALAELKLGEPKDAMQLLERAMAAAPQEVLIAVTLAQAKVAQKDSKGAEEVLKKACERSPKSADAVIILGRFYAAQDRAAEAEQQFRRALAMDPQSAAALSDLATVQNLTGRKQEAEQSFKRLSGLPGKMFKPAYATFLFQQGRRDEAIREFEKLAKEDPEDRLARTQLVVAYRAVNRAPDAEKILDKALKKNSRDLDALLQRGEMYLAAGKYEQAEADLNQVLHLKPDDAEVHYVLAKLHQARGTTLSYRQELSKALQLNPYLLSVRLELSENLIASDARAALDVLKETPSAQRQLMPVVVQRNWALWAVSDLPEMRKGIDAGLSRVRSTDLLLQDGLWKLRAENFTGARAALEEALKINPEDLRALSALKQSYEAQKQAPLALQKVKEYASRQPKSAPVQEFLGMMLLAHGDRAQARAALTAAKTASPQFTRADLSLVQLDTSEGKLDDARSRLNALLAADTGNSTARLWLGNIEEMKGNHNAALDQFRKVAEADPGNAQNLNNFAYLLAEYGKQPGEALKYAERAVELAPERPAYCDTLGWILYGKGLYTPAVQYLERANSHDHGDVVWKYHLAMAYAKRGDITRGRTTLEAALKVNPNVPEAKIAQQVIEASH
jgi:tetratricopeptide (TPR) repeat protein